MTITRVALCYLTAADGRGIRTYKRKSQVLLLSIRTMKIENANYVDGNGLRVGDNRESHALFNDCAKRGCTDKNKGITYWLDLDGTIKRIVLVHQMLI